MPIAVLDLNDRRPIWAMPEWVAEELRGALPSGWKLRAMDEETDGSGDGAARVAPAVLDAVSEAEIYFGYGIPGALIETGRKLRWVHSGAAGVGSSLTQALLESEVVFTNSAKVHAEPIAETVLGMLLYFGRGLDLAVGNQRDARWDTGRYYEAGTPLGELSMSTVGIVGFGGIGRAVARRVACLGARVIALKRTPGPGAPLTAPVGDASLDDRVEIVHGEDGLRALLERSDAVVLAVPDTVETRGMIDPAALDAMKPGAVLINVARGKVVDQEALVAVLEEGRIRGAGLDVFAREPLAEDSPLWGLRNVLVTPHVSAVTRGFWRRQTDLIRHNLRCHLEGAPLSAWRNVVDKRAGY